MIRSIRLATPADRAELNRLVAALFPHEPKGDLEAEIDAYLRDRTDLAAVFVAERSGSGLAGFLELGMRSCAEGCTSSPVPYVEAWYVDRDVRRGGIGRRLFAAAEDYARSHGFIEIASDVQLGNEVSISAHRALGYEETERLVCFRRSLIAAAEQKSPN